RAAPGSVRSCRGDGHTDWRPVCGETLALTALEPRGCVCCPAKSTTPPHGACSIASPSQDFVPTRLCMCLFGVRRKIGSPRWFPTASWNVVFNFLHSLVGCRKGARKPLPLLALASPDPPEHDTPTCRTRRHHPYAPRQTRHALRRADPHSSRFPL